MPFWHILNHEVNFILEEMLYLQTLLLAFLIYPSPKIAMNGSLFFITIPPHLPNKLESHQKQGAMCPWQSLPWTPLDLASSLYMFPSQDHRTLSRSLCVRHKPGCQRRWPSSRRLLDSMARRPPSVSCLPPAARWGGFRADQEMKGVQADF